jgi:3',5'-cyclic AMP phosphodiesterase CpdA
MRRLAALGATLLLAVACSSDPAPEATRRLPPEATAEGSVRFLAIGDFGSGGEWQHEIARAMCRHLDRRAFDYVVTTGDNVYKTGNPDGFDRKFFEPYDCLFDAGVSFHASLGNHDILTNGGRPQIRNDAFGMKGRYYAWRLGPVRFLVLDSNDVDAKQLAWMSERLERARTAPWTVVVFHHAVHSGGTEHGSTEGFAELFESRFEDAGVDLVLNGHDHVYSRAESGGITYIVTGGGGGALHDCHDELEEPVEKCVAEHHFLEVKASREALTVMALDKNEGLIERYEVQAND